MKNNFKGHKLHSISEIIGDSELDIISNTKTFHVISQPVLAISGETSGVCFNAIDFGLMIFEAEDSVPDTGIVDTG